MAYSALALKSMGGVIRSSKANAEYAFHYVAERYASTLAAIEDDYLRERATDMRDVTGQGCNFSTPKTGSCCGWRKRPPIWPTP